MHRKTFIILFLFTFVSGALSAQVRDSTLRNILACLTEYTEKIPWEEVYVHSDREEYISGEDFWCNVYLFDRKSLTISDESKIVYLEVLNSVNQPVVQMRILTRDGTGPGHFVLPDTLSTGYYLVRAYTNWMKNFLPGNCFMKEIVVFNALKQGDLKPARHSISAKPYLKADADGKSIKLRIEYTPDSVEIILEPEQKYSSEFRNVFYIVVQTRGNVDYATLINTDSTVTRRMISRKSLTSGINQIAILDAEGEPVIEKLIFTPSVRTDNFRIQARDSFSTREKIDLEITAYDTVQKGRFSISAAPVVDNAEFLNIEEYLIFGSEFNTADGTVSWHNLKGRSPEEADSILSGLTSNWIRWPEIIKRVFPETRYPHENEYHFLEGNIEDGKNDTVLLCFPGKEPWFQYAIADETGYFTFKLHIDEELHDLILMIDGTNKKRISLTSSFPSIYMQYNNIRSEEILPGRFSKMGINFQVMKIFRAHVKEESVGTWITRKPVSFYGQPQIEIRLSDFVELPTMSEIFLELVPDVSLRQRRTGYELLITDRISDRRFVFYPKPMIDGVIVRDASDIASIAPELVEKIDIVKRKYLVGDYMFDGIVNVITKTADFSCIQIPDYMVRTSYMIAKPVLVFVSPGYSGNEKIKSRIPDYRNTLYWNPSVPDSNAIEFWSSDNKMKYLVNIQGVTAGGKPFSIRKIVSVE
ncbi:MAG TPA: hypothetical protein VK207_09090 [Bacteroidales bacterium]|nr:hypothetical protein [Bacteroidales bacterium]